MNFIITKGPQHFNINSLAVLRIEPVTFCAKVEVATMPRYLSRFILHFKYFYHVVVCSLLASEPQDTGFNDCNNILKQIILGLLIRSLFSYSLSLIHTHTFTYNDIPQNIFSYQKVLVFINSNR